MNPEGQPEQQPPTQTPPNGVPPVSGSWPQQPQPLQDWQTGAAPTVDPQSSTLPQPIAPLQPEPKPYMLPSGADGLAPEYSIDYLNKIAPKEQKTVNRFAVLGLIGAGILSALFAVIIIASSGGPSANDQLIPVSERITTLQTVTKTEQTNLAEDQISEANASLSSALASMSANLQAIMKERGIKTSSGSDSAKTEKVYAASLTGTLSDSYQRGTLDRTYTSQMTYELTVLKTKITKLKESTDSKELQSFCATSLDNINLILKAYASFDATKS